MFSRSLGFRSCVTTRHRFSRKFISTSGRTSREEENMELFVISPHLKFTNLTIASNSTVSDLIGHFITKEVGRV